MMYVVFSHAYPPEHVFRVVVADTDGNRMDNDNIRKRYFKYIFTIYILCIYRKYIKQ